MACARLLQCKKLAENALSQCKGQENVEKFSSHPGEQPKKVKAPPRANRTSSDCVRCLQDFFFLD